MSKVKDTTQRFPQVAKSQKSRQSQQSAAKLIKSTVVFAVCLAIFLVAAPVFAQDAKPNVIPCVPNLPCIQASTQETGIKVREYVLGTFATKFLTIFLGMAALASVIFIIVGGMQMHVAFGNEEQIGKAKKTLIWAVAGLIIAILSVAIVQIISKLPLTGPQGR